MTYIYVKLIIIGIALLGGAVRVIARANHRAAIRAKMLAAPRTVEDNALVTLSGTAKLIGEPLIAPLSGRPCVAFRATARTYKTSSRPTKMAAPDQEVSEIVMTPFVLVTPQGDVLVDGDHCEMPIRGAPVIPRRLDRERAFMIRMALTGLPQTSGFDEVVIEPGAHILVHGIARTELATSGGETGFRDAPTRIRLSGDAAHPLTIDLP
jgi:hypothetical protein